MTDNPKSTFARRVRAAKARPKKYDIWDDAISGLALRVGTSGHRSFFLRRTVHGRIRSATIGNADTMTVPEARREARRLIATFIEPARKDNGPRTPGRPMDAFAGGGVPRTLRPALEAPHVGRQRLYRAQVHPARLRSSDRGRHRGRACQGLLRLHGRTPGSANRSMPTLSVMMRMAELWGYRLHNSNPCKNTKRYRAQAKERSLTAEEMGRLNAVLTHDEFWCPHIVAIVRLLMLTGCRRGEIVSLEWDWIKGKRILLPDSKSGPRTVWLSSAARAVIDAIPRYSDDCPYLFPARPATQPIDNIAFHWDRIRNEAGLPGLRLHDLLHSWASVAAMNGVDMVTIAKLLGHTLVETTERYVHLSDQSASDAADRVSARIHAALAGREKGGKRESRAVRPAQPGRTTQPRGEFRHVHI